MDYDSTAEQYMLYVSLVPNFTVGKMFVSCFVASIESLKVLT